MQYTLSVNKPGVIIAVPRSLLLTPKDDPEGIPNGELGLKGVLSKDKIAHAWMMIVTQANNDCYMEFRIPWINSNKQYDGEMRLDLDHPQSGSGCTAVINKYAIRQMF